MMRRELFTIWSQTFYWRVHSDFDSFWSSITYSSPKLSTTLWVWLCSPSDRCKSYRSLRLMVCLFTIFLVLSYLSLSNICRWVSTFLMSSWSSGVSTFLPKVILFGVGSSTKIFLFGVSMIYSSLNRGTVYCGSTSSAYKLSSLTAISNNYSPLSFWEMLFRSFG